MASNKNNNCFIPLLAVFDVTKRLNSKAVYQRSLLLLVSLSGDWHQSWCCAFLKDISCLPIFYVGTVDWQESGMILQFSIQR